MDSNDNKFPIGKLSHKFLGRMIKEFVKDLEIQDQRIIRGSMIGEDAAVLDIPGENYLVVKMDPITFATDEIGYYAVNVNVNDLVCTGAIPKWFQSTILLPEKLTTEELVSSIFKGIHDTCKDMEITVIGGHTEITSDINRPIVIGCLLGEVKKEELVLSSGAEEGDDLILTKGIFIEGTSIIAREKSNLLLQKGYSNQFIQESKEYLFNPGISIFREAILSNKNFPIKAMHDPTEGGLACGIAEMAIASQKGVKIKEKNIKILKHPLELSQAFNLNPLGVISSGSLLIAIEPQYSDELLNLLHKNNIEAFKIGCFIEQEKGLLIEDNSGKIKPLYYSETDEITKLF